jgi:hypothetical protein
LQSWSAKAPTDLGSAETNSLCQLGSSLNACASEHWSETEQCAQPKEGGGARNCIRQPWQRLQFVLYQQFAYWRHRRDREDEPDQKAQRSAPRKSNRLPDEWDFDSLEGLCIL